MTYAVSDNEIAWNALFLHMRFDEDTNKCLDSAILKYFNGAKVRYVRVE